MGKYIYTYIENGQMYDESPSLAELLAKEGLSCEKIVTGRIEYECQNQRWILDFCILSFIKYGILWKNTGKRIFKNLLTITEL